MSMVFATEHARIRSLLTVEDYIGDVDYDSGFYRLAEARVARVMAIIEGDADRDLLLEFVQSSRDFDRVESMALVEGRQAGWDEAALGIEPYLRR